MKSATGRNTDVFTNVAAVLARGYLRLTEKRHVLASSGSNFETEKPVDVPRRESPDVVTENPR